MLLPVNEDVYVFSMALFSVLSFSFYYSVITICSQFSLVVPFPALQRCFFSSFQFISFHFILPSFLFSLIHPFPSCLTLVLYPLIFVYLASFYTFSLFLSFSAYFFVFLSPTTFLFSPLHSFSFTDSCYFPPFSFHLTF